MDLKDTFAGPPPRRLYHCLNRPPEGDALQPTCEREVNGRTDKFLFAATHLTKALAFAFDYHDGGEIICNGGIEDSPNEFAIICDRDHTLAKPRYIRVVSFPDKGFEAAWPDSDSRQSVSTQPVPFATTETVLETDNVDDLMRRGLQIFSTDKTVAELEAENFFDTRAGFSSGKWLKKLVHDQDFRWENRERGLNPDSVLAQQLGGKTPAPAANEPG